jgi:hypothetical protein
MESQKIRYTGRVGGGSNKKNDTSVVLVPNIKTAETAQ